MFKAIGSALGGATRRMGNFGGETLSATPRALEKSVATPSIIIDRPPVSSGILSRVSAIEGRAAQNGSRNGLQEIADGTLSEKNPMEPIVLEPKEKTLTDDALDTLQSAGNVKPEPSTNNGQGFQIVSKTIEEVSESLPGSKPDDVVRQNPM